MFIWSLCKNISYMIGFYPFWHWDGDEPVNILYLVILRRQKIPGAVYHIDNYVSAHVCPRIIYTYITFMPK